jgi:voltage-gated potassium channel
MTTVGTKTAEPLRSKLFVQLEPSAWPRAGLSPVNKLVAATICIAVSVAILESEPEIFAGRESLFFLIEALLATFFAVEYSARLWVAGEKAGYAGIIGRFRYALSPPALIDLLALLPILFSVVGSEAFLFRLFRLIRILRLARLGRYSTAIGAITYAIKSRRYELTMSLAIAGLLLLVSSTLLYLVESDTQPEDFGSIPRAMWWSIATLTTVGYGDAFPVTVVGRILAGATAIIGIGLIAMPTGILAAAFSDALQKQREAKAGKKVKSTPYSRRSTTGPPASK